MTQDQGRSSAVNTGVAGAKHEDAELARAYQQAAAGDAYHQRGGASSAPGEQPIALVPKKEGEGAPSTDPAPEDKVVEGSHRAPDGAADGGATVSDEALQRGLTPGEMGAGKEPQENTKARLSPRYSDAELSGMEHGETGEETRERDVAQISTSQEPRPPMKSGTKSDEAKAPIRQPSRFTDAELSGLEPGETSTE